MNTVKIAERCGTDVSSRASAAQLRAEVLRLLAAGADVVTIDCAGVRTISGSFADELFAVLVVELGEDFFNEHVKVISLAELPRETVLEAVAERLEPA